MHNNIADFVYNMGSCEFDIAQGLVHKGSGCVFHGVIFLRVLHSNSIHAGGEPLPETAVKKSGGKTTRRRRRNAANDRRGGIIGFYSCFLILSRLFAISVSSMQYLESRAGNFKIPEFTPKIC